MNNEVESLIDSLPIPRSEWLLTEDADTLDLSTFRKKVVWEYARTSSCLRELFEEAVDACQWALRGEDNSTDAASDYLYRLAQECIWYSFHPWSGSSPEDPNELVSDEARAQVLHLLAAIHLKLSEFDWRFLLSPFFPSPWDESQGWDKLAAHTLTWDPPPVAGRGLWLRGLPQTAFVGCLSCKIEDGDLIADNAAFSDERLREVDPDFERQVAVTLVLVPTIMVRGKEISDVAATISLCFERAAGDRVSSAVGGAIKLHGKIGVDAIRFDPDPASRELLLRALSVWAGNANMTNDLTAFIAPEATLKRGEVTRVATYSAVFNILRSVRNIIAWPSATESPDHGHESWLNDFAPCRSIFQYQESDCLRALKDLGARRIAKADCADKFEKLWRRESLSLRTIAIKRRSKKTSSLAKSERKVASHRPIYSKREALIAAADAVPAHLKKIFPSLEDVRLIPS